MSSRNGTATLPRRRNGKQQACEPCRKAKIACDHTFPVCDRCKRRKVSEKCVFLDAPMTRSPAERKRDSTFNLPTPKTASSASPAPCLSPRLQPKSIASESGPFIKSGGFFGPTNFGAVFVENRENLGHDDIQISNDSEPYVRTNDSLQSQTFLMIAGHECCDSPRVYLGMKLLTALPDHNTCKFLLEWYFKNSHECTFPKPSVMACSSSFWSTFDQHLKEPRRLEDLKIVSELICTNAESPAPDDFEDYEGWLSSFCGTNFRWESVGYIFGALTSALLCLPERDAFFCTQSGQRQNRKHFAMEMKDCVQACVTLSNYMDLINMQMVSLLAKNLILQTVLSGDTSLLVWRQLGDLVSASTALGLHREVEIDRPVTFVSELRRRIFTVIFNIDKGSSLLTGRPPALSYRYCRFKLPLDISEDIMVRGGEDLARAVEKLDVNGWNTEQQIYPSTFTRAHGQLALVLNDILELSLGYCENCTGASINKLLNRVHQTYESFPDFIRWNPQSYPTNVSDDVFYQRLALRLIVLEHRLLLERLAHKQELRDGQSMVDCAREMLELIVLLWVQRDRFVEHHHDYDWMLMCWGVPSSGVLCVELLKQMKAPPGTPYVPILPRSEIVQNLSLLIGFLEWVRPAAGNYKLCGRMRQIIKRILDQILNPTPQASQDSLQDINLQGQQQILETTNMVEGFDSTVFETGSFDEGLDNLDWLNSVDWSRGPWIDLGGQDYSAAKWA